MLTISRKMDNTSFRLGYLETRMNALQSDFIDRMYLLEQKIERQGKVILTLRKENEELKNKFHNLKRIEQRDEQETEAKVQHPVDEAIEYKKKEKEDDGNENVPEKSMET